MKRPFYDFHPMATEKRGRSSEGSEDLLSLPISYSRPRCASLFLLTIVGLHVLLYAGALDLYFSTPVVRNIERTYSADLGVPPAKRVVLFVVDGLGLNALFHDDLKATPHLRRVVKGRGSWAVSVARTPTLSRPGHLSLLSGVYELMHGVSRDRYTNPFDSVANRSSASYLLGEAEIVDMFKTPNVSTFSYPDTLNDFSMSDPALLDRWVFQRLSTVLSNRSFPFPSSKLFFMTHLLGVDTFSHSRSASPDRLAPLLANVDAGIARAEAEFRRTFGDDRTAFLLSADHGMSSWSAHGAGDSEAEVETPLLAWGAGIGNWSHGGRIGQVDVCALISALLNIPFPVNSVGKVPLRFLALPPAARLAIARANAAQAAEQFLTLRRSVKIREGPLFADLPGLSPDEVRDGLRGGVGQLGALVDAVGAGLYRLERLHASADKFLLCTLFVLLMLTLALGCIEENGETTTPSRREVAVFVGLLFAPAILHLVARRSLLQMLTWASAVILAWAVWRRRARLHGLATNGGRRAICGLALLQLVAFGFVERRVMSVMMLGVAAWQGGGGGRERRWFALGCVVVAVFPFLPTIGSLRSVTLVSLGSTLTAATAGLFLATARGERRVARILLLVQTLLLLASCVVHNRAHLSIRALHGLPSLTIIATRSLLLLSLLAVIAVSFVASQHAVLVSIWLAIAVTFTVCSLAFETVFIFVFGVTLAAWVKLHEDADLQTTKHALSYVLLVFVSLFGIGNFPSISSYDPQMVLCFQSVFDLAVMSIIMFLRNMLPVQMVTSPFLVLTDNDCFLRRYRMAIFLIDVVGLQFYIRLHFTADFLYLAAMINQLSIALAFVVMVTICFLMHRWVVEHRL